MCTSRSRSIPRTSRSSIPWWRARCARVRSAAAIRRATRCCAVQIHGDAAFAGQGVVMETLQLSQARGFYTGGSVHIIINNQVGFTTSDPHDARSTLYCSDVAKMVEAPIFHVNADDPEAVCFVTRSRSSIGVKFHKDVVIDLVCYRRHGHNEADEPAATQPLMYQVIRKKPTARQLYADKLAAEGVLTAADAAAMMDQYRSGLDEGKPAGAGRARPDRQPVYGRLERVPGRRLVGAGKTAVDMRAIARARQGDHHLSGGLDFASARARRSCRRASAWWRRARPRLGLRRESRLREPDPGRLSGAPHRPGQRPRHVLPPPCGSARSDHRPDATFRSSTWRPISRPSR